MGGGGAGARGEWRGLWKTLALHSAFGVEDTSRGGSGAAYRGPTWISQMDSRTLRAFWDGNWRWDAGLGHSRALGTRWRLADTRICSIRARECIRRFCVPPMVLLRLNPGLALQPRCRPSSCQSSVSALHSDDLEAGPGPRLRHERDTDTLHFACMQRQQAGSPQAPIRRDKRPRAVALCSAAIDEAGVVRMLREVPRTYLRAPRSF